MVRHFTLLAGLVVVAGVTARAVDTSRAAQQVEAIRANTVPAHGVVMVKIGTPR